MKYTIKFNNDNGSLEVEKITCDCDFEQAEAANEIIMQVIKDVKAMNTTEESVVVRGTDSDEEKVECQDIVEYRDYDDDNDGSK